MILGRNHLIFPSPHERAVLPSLRYDDADDRYQQPNWREPEAIAVAAEAHEDKDEEAVDEPEQGVVGKEVGDE